jgi:hypothetical protein
MKTEDDPKGTAFEVPLSDPAIAILRAVIPKVPYPRRGAAIAGRKPFPHHRSRGGGGTKIVGPIARSYGPTKIMKLKGPTLTQASEFL